MPGELIFVSAGAGSGKTHRLTDLLYEELRSQRARPEGVIATTFTKKAATELRERVRGSLLEHGEFGLANAIGQARMGTVNSVCGQLLERFAFEAGLATELQVLDENQADRMLREASDAVLDAATVDKINQLAARLGVEDWQQTLRKLVNTARANDIAPERLAAFGNTNATDLLSFFPAATDADLDVALRDAINAAMPALREAAATGGKKVTATYLTLVEDVLGGLGNGGLPWSVWPKLAKANPEAALRPAVSDVADRADRYAAHPRLHADVRSYLDHLFSLCARVLDVYATRKSDMGAIDFTDQEHLLLKILDRPAVSAVLREELDLLLVDEFQDTSPIQLALFVKLSGFAARTYWVGDVKQAIYGFRGSDTELMQAVLEALPSLGGRKQILERSWRSRPSLVELVNRAFTPAFANSLVKDEVILRPQRTEFAETTVLENWMLDGNNIRKCAAALACGIQGLVGSGYVVHDKHAGTERPVRFADIAVLASSNDHVKDLAAALGTAGIRAATTQPGLLERPEAVLTLACLRRLNDAGDTIATAEILSLADCQEPEVWLAHRLQHLAAGGDPGRWREEAPDAHPLLARLASLRTQLPLLAPREAIQLVITQSELPLRVLRWCRDEAEARVRLANLEQLVQLAADYEDFCASERSAATISGLIGWLHDQAAAALDALAEPAIDAVKVLTHHGAKGLEWPVVILTDLEKDVRTRLWDVSVVSQGPLDVNDPLKDRFIRYWPWPFGQQKKVSLADEIAGTAVAQQFQQAAVEESKRLLYVSMTRARDLLVIARQIKKPTGPWIETIDAPWLLPEETADSIELAEGTVARCGYRRLEPPEDGAADLSPRQRLHWYPSADAWTTRLPLFVNPSLAEPIECEIGEPIAIGERIPLKAGTDITILGTAIHACMAAAFADRASSLSVAEIDAIVSGAGLQGRVSAEPIRNQISALDDWIDARWPGCKTLSETPVERILANGQVLRGQIDLLVGTPAGWVLIDHKSNPGGLSDSGKLARGYSGQLKAYADAVAAATGRPVIEAWLFLPVAGGAVQVCV